MCVYVCEGEGGRSHSLAYTEVLTRISNLNAGFPVNFTFKFDRKLGLTTTLDMLLTICYICSNAKWEQMT